MSALLLGIVSARSTNFHVIWHFYYEVLFLLLLAVVEGRITISYYIVLRYASNYHKIQFLRFLESQSINVILWQTKVSAFINYYYRSVADLIVRSKSSWLRALMNSSQNAKIEIKLNVKQ